MAYAKHREMNNCVWKIITFNRYETVEHQSSRMTTIKRFSTEVQRATEDETTSNPSNHALFATDSWKIFPYWDYDDLRQQKVIRKQILPPHSTHYAHSVTFVNCTHARTLKFIISRKPRSFSDEIPWLWYNFFLICLPDRTWVRKKNSCYDKK